MDAGGYVLAGVTAMIGVGLGLFHRVHEAVNELRANMRDQLSSAYREFGQTIVSHAVVQEQLAFSVSRLARLHASLLHDFTLARTAENMAERLIPTVLALVLVASAGLAVGHVCLGNASLPVQSVPLLAVPFLALVGELVYLKMLLSRDRELRKASAKYKRAEY
jgi:hypothetical protein